MGFEFLIVLMLLAIFKMTSQELLEPAVTLSSTLKQSSLCPGQGDVFFKCTTLGNQLSWIVNGAKMSYLAESRVGSVRTHADADITANLIWKENLDDSGMTFYMVSVLQIRDAANASGIINVQCHNGSDSETRGQNFSRQIADPPQEPANLTASYSQGTLTISWTQPEDNPEAISFYKIKIGHYSPVFVMNTTFTYPFDHTSSTELPVSVTTSDKCDQESQAKSIIIAVANLETTSELISRADRSVSDINLVQQGLLLILLFLL